MSKSTAAIRVRAETIRKQETIDSEIALRPVRAAYEKLWAALRHDCGLSGDGHRWHIAGHTEGCDAIYRCEVCAMRRTVKIDTRDDYGLNEK